MTGTSRADLRRVASSGPAVANGPTPAQEPTQGHTGGDRRTRPDRGADQYSGGADDDADERVRGHPTRLAGAYAKRSQDPAALAPGERLAELAGILAAGYRRVRLSREKALAESEGAERSCDLVDSPENEDAPEVA